MIHMYVYRCIHRTGSGGHVRAMKNSRAGAMQFNQARIFKGEKNAGALLCLHAVHLKYTAERWHCIYTCRYRENMCVYAVKVYSIAKLKTAKLNSGMRLYIANIRARVKDTLATRKRERERNIKGASTCVRELGGHCR